MSIDSESYIFGLNSCPHGTSYEVWTANWWRWAFSVPKNRNAIVDKTGQFSAEGQSGPVWYLAGTTGETSFAERECVIDSSKSVLFPIIVSQFSFAEVPFIKKAQDLISLTSKDIDKCSFLEAVIDGKPLQNLFSCRVQYGPFLLHVCENNIWNLRAGPTRAVSDGFWVFLRPLSKGNHTIKFMGMEPNFNTKVTYHLTVV